MGDWVEAEAAAETYSYKRLPIGVLRANQQAADLQILHTTRRDSAEAP